LKHAAWREAGEVQGLGQNSVERRRNVFSVRPGRRFQFKHTQNKHTWSCAV